MSARGPLSLRGRLIIAFTAIALISVGSAAAVAVLTHDHLIQQLDDKLAAFGAPRFGLDPNGPMPPAPAPDKEPASSESDYDALDGSDRPSDVLKAVLTSDGVLAVLYSPNVEYEGEVALPVLDYAALSGSAQTFLTVPSDDGAVQYRVLAQTRDGFIDITALPTTSVDDATTRLVAIEAAALVALLGGLAITAQWVTRLGLTPMRRMISASQKIAQGDLTIRVEDGAGSAETIALADSLNTMLETLTSALDERKAAEEKLRQFVADASHELRTPLTTLLGYHQLYRKGALGSPAALDDAMSRSQAEAERMKRLVEDLLVLATLDQAPELSTGPVPLAALCKDVAANLVAAHPEAKITVARGAAGVVARGDTDKLRQALINVVTNAVSHSEGPATVTLRVFEDGGRVGVEVTDRGVGMSREVLSRATERFVRGDASRARGSAGAGGAGLGLAITAAIVQAHGGTLGLASVEGKGSTVTIWLPAYDAQP